MKLACNFKIDMITSKEIPMRDVRERFLKESGRTGGTCYSSEVSNFYHMEKYGKSLVEVLFDKGIEMPLCPITGRYPSYRLQGSIVFGKYSSSCSTKDIADYVVRNNPSYQEHVQRMRVERRGSGNPMFNKISWNKGLTKESNEKLMKISKNRKGIQFSNETLSKMAKSASDREVHGHTGHKHSDETKARLRELTIRRHRSGGYPKTKTVPHNKVKQWLIDLKYEFEEEFEFDGFVFDFKVANVLIEVQGDFFHCNPKTRHKTPKSDIQKKNVDRDVRKRSAVETSDFVLLELWENDILKNEQKTKQIISCLKN